MISKVTIFSLLLTLLLAAGIVRWDVQHQDDCDRYLAGAQGYPSTQTVVVGQKQVEISCKLWLPRQPKSVQIFCLLNLTLGVVFLLNALADLRRTLEARRRDVSRA